LEVLKFFTEEEAGDFYSESAANKKLGTGSFCHVITATKIEGYK